MDKFDEYKALLNEDEITAVRDRREAIARAIDTLIAQMDEFHAERKKLDEKDQYLYNLAQSLDDAHARITRGFKYTPQAKKRITRRYWEDETHIWVEQFLLEWIRKQLQDGPKEIGALYGEMPGRFAMADVVKLMESRPEEFSLGKSAKPPRKYARASYVWSLKNSARRSGSSSIPHYWNVEIAMDNGGRQRQQTLSERMHEMLEEAIQSFYAQKFTSVVHAFSDLFWKDLANSYIWQKQRADVLQIQLDQAKQNAQGGNATSQDLSRLTRSGLGRNARPPARRTPQWATSAGIDIFELDQDRRCNPYSQGIASVLRSSPNRELVVEPEVPPKPTERTLFDSM